MNSSNKITEAIDSKLAKELNADAEIRKLWSQSIHCRDKRQTFNKANEVYDFIIVGAGTAGCVLARELIYNVPNINILLLEAGPPNVQVNNIMRLPCTFASVYRMSEADWGYHTEDQKMPSSIDPTKEVLNKAKPFPRGKIVGGCSTVNSMVY
ncbi:6612_t:CDS:2, partial [Funneliformis geosporum]